jgi:UDP-3-O-[3-hydroxymyristoyl] glucosamine N-acyltransferase
MDDVTIGDDTRLTANVTFCHGVVVGSRCLFQPSVVVGGDGFGLAPDQGEWLKVPQVGTVRIGNDVEIGASTTIDRGAIEDTVIGNGVKMDNQIQIGHNVRIGEHTAIAGCAGISGSATIGKRCMIGGMVGVAGHLSICDDVVLTGKSFVNSSIRKPGYYSSAIPFDEAARFRKNAARFHRLDEFVREVRRERGAADEATGDESDDATRGE